MVCAILVQDIIRETKKEKVLKALKNALEKGYASKKEGRGTETLHQDMGPFKYDSRGTNLER